MRKLLLTISLLLLPVIAHSAVEISDVYELQDMLTDLTTDYVLINDIDASTTTTWNYNAGEGYYEGFDPVGFSHEENQFQGNFDGQGFTIVGLYAFYNDRPAGLFGATRYGDSLIKNVILKNFDITGSFGGALVGLQFDVNATIENIGVEDSTVESTTADAGGVTGCNYGGEIKNSYAINNTIKGSRAAGGFVGLLDRYDALIENSYATGYVEGGDYAGGFVGWCYRDNIITNSFSTSETTGTTTETNVGGFIGKDEGNLTLTKSYWNTETSGQATSDGGSEAIGRTTAQMTDHENDYPDAYDNYDFTNIWQVTSWNTDQEGNAGYPALAWQEEPPTPTPVIEKWIPYIIRYD